MAHGRIIMVISSDKQMTNAIPESYKEGRSVLCASTLREAQATLRSWKHRLHRIYLDPETHHTSDRAAGPAPSVINTIINECKSLEIEVIIIGHIIERFEQPTIRSTDVIEDIATFLNTPV